MVLDFLSALDLVALVLRAVVGFLDEFRPVD
jgi:hypothetical protein